MVFSWFRRRRLSGDAPTLRPRRERRAGARSDLSEIAPEASALLGNAACLLLGEFQELSALVGQVPALPVKEQAGIAAGRALTRHQRLVAELRRRDTDPADAMEPFTGPVDRFRAATHASTWQESLLRAHLVGGLLDDFFAGLAPGVADAGHALAPLFAADPGEEEALSAILLAEIEADAQLAARLALWGRRLVGDTLLFARSALRLSGDPDVDEAHVEPLMAEVIAAHTRRMDALGLTA